MWAYPGRFLNKQTSCQIKNAANFQGIFQLWIAEIIFPLRSEPHDLIIFKQNEMQPVTHHTAATSRLKDWCNPPVAFPPVTLIFIYLMLYRTLPSWKIRSSLLSVVTSWKLAPFSFAKNKSGFQIESNMDGSRSRESSGYSLYARRGSFHFCLRNTLSL